MIGLAKSVLICGADCYALASSDVIDGDALVDACDELAWALCSMRDAAVKLRAEDL